MSIRFAFQIDGKPAFDRAFQKLDESIKDFTPIWDEVRTELFSAFTDQFQSGGAAGASGKWKELSPAYEKIKVAKFGMGALIAGPLFATERLYKSLTRDTADSVFESSKDEMTIGTKVPYAGFHQRGGGNLPQREIISLSAKQKRGIQKKLASMIRGAGWTADENNFTEL